MNLNKIFNNPQQAAASKMKPQAKHTPGKWVKNNNINDLTIRAGKQGFVIAELTSTGISHFLGNEEEAEANAILISSAPYMLHILEQVKRICEGSQDIQLIRTAVTVVIDKATN